MRRLLILCVVMPFAAPACRAGSSLESLWSQGAQFNTVIPKALAMPKGLPNPEDPPDPAAALRAAKMGVERAYRVEMVDLRMLHDTAAELKGLVAKFASAPGDSARDVIENRLKFLVDALPVASDHMDGVGNRVEYLRFELPAKVAPELDQAVRDLDAGVNRVAATVAQFEAEATALQSQVGAAAGIGERAPWLAQNLLESAQQLSKSAAFMQKDSAEVVAMLATHRKPL